MSIVQMKPNKVTRGLWVKFKPNKPERAKNNGWVVILGQCASQVVSVFNLEW